LFLAVPGLSVGSTTDARLSDTPGYMIENLEKARQQQMALLDKAGSIFQMNTAAEELLQDMADKNHDGNVNQLSFDDLATLGTKHLWFHTIMLESLRM
jgi:hypothetical protein